MSIETAALNQAILKAFKVGLEDIIEEEIKVAQEKIQRRIREKTSHIVMSCMELFSIERQGTEIRITVKNFKMD